MIRPLKFVPALFFATLSLVASARAVTIEQIISRENPLYDNKGAELTVGRDGMVYLHSHLLYNGYVTRLTRTGADKTGGDSGPATLNVAVNANGIMAAANAHFTHAVGLYDTNFVRYTQVSNDFVSWTAEFGEGSGYNEPSRVEAGQSGDFYASDQFHDRILRIEPSGRVVKTYTIPRAEGGVSGLVWDFRVNEKTQTFYVRPRDTSQIRAISFDGTVRWSAKIDTSGGFDVDDDGTLYAASPHSDTIAKLSPAGQPAGDIKLTGQIAGEGDFKTAIAQYPITSMRVYKTEILLRRAHPTEMFERFDLGSGALQQAVASDFERLTLTYPNEVWTAGETIPLTIEHRDPLHNAKPLWHVWARGLSTPDYRELKVVGGKLQVPADMVGIFQLKVTPEAQPWQRGTASEYLVQSWIEVRSPHSQGSVNVLTTDNRPYFGRGEAIPFGVLLRGDKTLQGKMLPVTVRLVEVAPGMTVPAKGACVLAEAKSTATIGQSLQFALPASLSGALRPGRYLLSATAPNLTPVAQPLVIGPAPQRTEFNLVQYGDYEQPGFYPSSATVWTAPDLISSYLDQLHRVGVNLVAERIGAAPGEVNPANIRSQVETLRARLAADPLAAAPDKVLMASLLQQSEAGLSATGVSQMPILLYMDTALPVGKGNDTPEKIDDRITTISKGLLPFPAFRGWSWAANTWIWDRNLVYANDGEKTAYAAALKKANDTGAWDAVLDTVGARRFSFAADAEKQFDDVLHKTAPDKISAIAGPYRSIDAYPPATFSNVDEVDLHYQAEQIQPPNTTWHNVDYQKRPGKRAWGHPELWNDNGTGDQILTSFFGMAMRGTDGVGSSGSVHTWGNQPEDPRNPSFGRVSVYRAAYRFFHQYGPWLTSLQNNDHVAIVVSRRMADIDDWKGVGGQYFTRLYEAYQACLYAHYPASFVFTDDLQPDTLSRYKAVLVVGQRVEIDPTLLSALQRAKAKGTAIFTDGTSRPEVVKEFKPLGISFDKVENDPSVWQDDSSYWRFPTYFMAEYPALVKALKPLLPPVAEAANPQVLLSERAAEDGRYLWVVNNTITSLEPGQLWRMTKYITTRVPMVVSVKPAAAGKTIYDVFAMQPVMPKQGSISADLLTLPARLYAILPTAIKGVAVRGPRSVRAGQVFAWSVQVQDAGGKPIRAAIPIRLRLLDSKGEVLEERVVSCGSKGAGGRMRAPLNAASGVQRLEATELFSGQSAQLSIALTPATLPLKIATGTGNALNESVLSADTLGGRSVGIARPTAADFGPHIRDVVVTGNGQLAILNTMDWTSNLYGLDVATGKMKWQHRVGDYFAFAPQALQSGFVVQGFDFKSPEGYHLYFADNAGKPERRFALDGLPKGLPSWAAAAQLLDHINNFATPEDGSWVASAGDLGLIVWNRAGKVLWSQDWTADRHVSTLTVLDHNTLVVSTGMTATAYDASTGSRKWQLTLAANGEIRGGKASRDGSTLVLRSTADSGRVFVIRDGKVTTSFLTTAEDMAISDDGSLLALTTGNLLKVYAVAGGLSWSFSGDDLLHFPRLSPDGKRLAVSSELGSTYVLDRDSKVLLTKDMGALAAPAWLPGGDLLLGTWMGEVTRLGTDYTTKWSAHLQPNPKPEPVQNTPTVRVSGWSNAAAQTAPLTPNLLKDTNALISVQMNDRPLELQNKVADLVDGKPDAPAQPWLLWNNVNMIDSGWSGSLSIILDTFRTQLHVTGITFVEDPAHPESWLRDVNLEYWDATKAQWVFGASLLSDSAVHTHQLPKPIDAARFRLVKSKTGGTWPVGNIRLGEIVLHGQALGASHPDVIAKRPLAVLFDEGDDLKSAMMGLDYKFDDAFSGGRSLLVDNKQAAPQYTPPFGHALPGWNFEIAENPQPGQYRYLQFAWKALSPQTTGMALLIGNAFPGGGINVSAGTYNWGQGVLVEKKVADTPPTAWHTVRIDMWDALKKPMNVQSLLLGAAGGPAAFDQLVLGRTEADLPPMK